MKKTGKNKPRPPMTKTKVRVQVVLEREILEKVDYYAEKYNQSRSYFCSRAIEQNVTSDSFMHDIALSRMLKPITTICKKLYGEKNKKKRQEYMAILDHMTRENLEEFEPGK